MRNSRGWQIFRRNTPALTGLILFLLLFILALLAPVLSTDTTLHASRQVPEAIRQPPFYSGRFLKGVDRSGETSWWMRMLAGEETAGRWYRTMEDPEIVFHADTVWVSLWGGNRRFFLLPGLMLTPDAEASFTQACLQRFSRPWLSTAEYCIWQESGELHIRSWAELHQQLETEHLFSFTWWMGSDGLGRDVFSRMLKGSRVTIGVGIAALILSLLIGVPLGILAGYFGGWADRLIQGVISVIWSLPSLLLAMVLSFVLGKGFWQVFLAVGLTLWVDVARMVRGSVMGLKEAQFIEAGRALGYSTFRILGVHILPNLAGPVILVATSCFATAVLIESGLSFLGIGIQPPMPSWGNLLQEGHTQIVLSGGQWLAIFPSLAIVILVVSLNLIGYGLRDALDPKEKV